MHLQSFLVLCLLVFAAKAGIINTGTGATKYTPGVGGTSASVSHPSTMQKSLTTQWGFDEKQCVTLTNALTTDQGTIPVGTVVSSHFVYYNTFTTGMSATIQATWTFDAEVLGTMSDGSGTKIIASNSQCARAGVTYFNAPISNYGVDPLSTVSYTGDVLTFDATVNDWVDALRVITKCNLCTYNNVVCSASDPCHAVGTCDRNTGVCSNPAQPNGFGCSDGNACTLNDSCQSGVCSGTPKVCTAPQCKVPGTCNPATGACSMTNSANNIPCNDGNGCTEEDKCTNGICGGINVCDCSFDGKCGVCRARIPDLDDVLLLFGIPAEHACDNKLLISGCGLLGLGLLGDCCAPVNQTGLVC